MPVALYALTAGAFGIGVTEFVIMGLLLEVSRELNVTIAAAGLLISGYALGVTIGAPVLTVLTARWPRKHVLVGLMVIFVIGNAACALAPARVILSDVLVDTPNEGAVVVIGDSITDGNGATVDADARWPDFLAERLAPQRIAVLNAGISGSRLLQDKMGVNVVARLERDVFAQPNVTAAILLIGINDISWPGTDFAPDQVRPSAEEMIAGYRQIIALAEANNVRLTGATLPPFEGALSGTPLGNYYHTDKDALRREINRWIRESGAFDAIVDFDAVLRDPGHPARINPAFDSGDHLHPGDEGNRAMAEAIDLDALLGR